MTIKIHFTPHNWERIEHDWSAWWAGDLNRPMIIANVAEKPEGKRAALFPLDTPADDVIDYYQDILEHKYFYGDGWPKWWPDFGPGIMAGFLGARVQGDENTVWFEPTQQGPLVDLHLAYDAENPWWRRVQELTRTAVKRWGDQVCVGFTDFGGNMDILASLHTTQQLLLELYDDPDEVERLTCEITPLWHRYFAEFYPLIQNVGRGSTPWLDIWSPGRCYALQSDFSYMISPKMFERYVLPDLAACCEIMEHPFYHLDGKGELPHLDMLLGLEKLCGIQWVPGDGAPPPEQWLPVLKRIRDAGKRCHVEVTPEGARTIIHALGGRGFAFKISDFTSRDEAQTVVQMLLAENK
jgi:5-methyltetrahydrofolate--homocysteine methyltransferase